MTLYGIPNCDTTKKAMQLLKKNNVAFTFHDYKQHGITKEKLQQWIDAKGLEPIFNKRSTTWKELNTTEQAKATTMKGAIEIMLTHNSIIKRPIIETNNKLLVGYNETELRASFKN